MPSTWTLITSTTLGSNTANFDFQNIPASYYDLRLLLSVRGTTTTGNDCDVNMTINGVSSGYRSVMMYPNTNTSTTGTSNGVSGTSLVGTSMPWGGGVMPTANGTANSFMNGWVLIPGYVNTENLPVRTLGSWFGSIRAGGSNVFYGAAYGASNTTSVVNRVTLTPSSGLFLAGSTVSLYGVKNTNS